MFCSSYHYFFISEDLVSHVNQRNVVLCILEVARIACTKYSFSPAPGLVELEQEIDREIEQELQLQKQIEQSKGISKNCQKPEIPDKPAALRSKTAQHHSRNISRQLWPNDDNDLTTQRDDIDSIDSTGSSFVRTTTLVNQHSMMNKECQNDDEEDITLISAQNDSKDVGFVDADSGCSYSSSNHSDSVLPRSPS
ncbi:hypothetical protein BLA29_011080, partial [Euroglyphus maynei]